MAKGKNLNPADAHRKAMRKKEIKKNKATREKTREISTLKKDTGGLDAEIRRLEEASRNGELDKNQKTRLEELRSEVQRIKKTKADYVAAHPEHRKLVYGEQSTASTSKAKDDDDGRGLFGKNGLPRHPERSIYYDPVMNPFGMPPPGLPYVERPLLPHELPPRIEIQSDGESDEGESDSDEDIPLPAGPPPLPPGHPGDDDESPDDDDDDIPMPKGPPPPRNADEQTVPPVPPLPTINPRSGFSPVPPAPIAYNPTFSAPAGFTPPPPYPPISPNGNPQTFGIPPPPPGFPSAMPYFPPASSFAPGGMMIPPPPPPFPPPRQLNHHGFPASIQDPLSSEPHRTYQEHRLQQHQNGIPSVIPSISSQIPSQSALAVGTSTTISAAPQLRDLKKESTAFVPNAVKRKKGQVPQDTTTAQKKARVNAAPDSGDFADGSGRRSPEITHPLDLLSAVQSHFPRRTVGEKTNAVNGPDDYDKFMAEMGDMLAGGSNSK